ncbi:phosphomannomutase/phosphoglucomutase [Methanococcus maripaludis]|uniref:Phosphomannomutase n=1 Tax=Methanococcus maripaludis TaxID=39152 RepID=A0A2L1CBV7_METMI|nr:phosphomannomutase/phosphoglucomutase [Methanococcus maripaludis]AVB76845.1 Phosphomannomutase/phosphoglucomutase [Methanococcus maripaludis]MBA2863355.1 phosphomannomutase [Methanococcus maripaludis]MBB6496641.1 phosphomannomutase [Methanococcus maripaludis]
MVFKAYDIRGIYEKDLDDNFAYSLGKLVGKNYERIMVGNDIRIGSKKLLKPFIYGILENSKVYYAGEISTPLMYFGTLKKFDLGVILTASHNPKEYTGFKMCDIDAIPLSPVDEIKPDFEMFELSEEQKEEIENLDLESLKVDILSKYLNFFTKKLEKTNRKIAVDFANGATTNAEKKVLEKVLENKIFVNDFPDGNFPAHEPDTLKKECLIDIINTVKTNFCEFGLIFDGDGDRIGMVDEKGEILAGDILTAIISNEILNEVKGKIVYDLRCSKVVPETISKNGGTPVKTRVGHYFIKKLMHEIDAEFAGEFSNHFYFKSTGYFESPLLALNYILKALEREGKPLSEISKNYKKYFHSGEINFKVANQKKSIESIEKKYENICKIEKLDGISLYCNDFWFNVRSSNTEPLLRLNLEADDEKTMNEKLTEIKEIINS